MMGRSPKSSSARDRPLASSDGKDELLKERDQVWIFLPDLVNLQVLPVQNVFQFVMMNEVENPVGGDVPGLGQLDLPEQALDGACLSMIFLARKRPALLPPSFPWQRGGKMILPSRS